MKTFIKSLLLTAALVSIIVAAMLSSCSIQQTADITTAATAAVGTAQAIKDTAADMVDVTIEERPTDAPVVSFSVTICFAEGFQTMLGPIETNNGTIALNDNRLEFTKNGDQMVTEFLQLDFEGDKAFKGVDLHVCAGPTVLYDPDSVD